MRTPLGPLLALAALAALAAGPLLPAAAEDRPNVLILYVDDLGYADLGATGGTAVATPHIDSLARDGARFANGYASGCVCSPSRAGLLTGRYQQRFGFDANAEGDEKPNRPPRGLEPNQPTFADRMKGLGYATGLVGKWHLGAADGYRPSQRGFDEFYGLLPHGIGAGRGEPVPMFRGDERVAVPDDHTTAFADEAVAFIARHRDEPWFLDVAFTAVHAPHVAPQQYLDRFAGRPKAEQNYHAMIACLDDAIGRVLGSLRERGIEENTLVFFSGDNGGPTGRAIDNGPFRGGKWTLWEGGVRTPVFIRWPGRVPAGRELPHPINQLDFLPTALAAAGAEPMPEWKLDGVDLLPYLTGEKADAPHDALYWRFGVQYAVRQGDWKLVKPSRDDEPKLFDLAADPGEQHDLAAAQPDRVKRLQALWDAWNAANEPPRWTDERWNGQEERARNKGAKRKTRGT